MALDRHFALAGKSVPLTGATTGIGLVMAIAIARAVPEQNVRAQLLLLPEASTRSATSNTVPIAGSTQRPLPPLKYHELPPVRPAAGAV